MTKARKPTKGAGKPRSPGKLQWSELTDPTVTPATVTKAGATRKRVAKDGTRRGIDAHRGAPKITEEVIQTLEKELETGFPIESACRVVKIWPSALQQKMEVDIEFAERIEQARARGERTVYASHLDLAFQGGRTSGTEFVLERQWPKHWKPAPQSLKQEVTGKDGAPVESVSVVRYEYVAPKNPIIDGDG